jgi:hypothetical protein
MSSGFGRRRRNRRRTQSELINFSGARAIERG